MTQLAQTDLTTDQARTLTDEIRVQADILVPLVAEAYRGRAWRALGYESWDAYRTAEFPAVRVAVEGRPDAVRELRGAGMSQRQIADTIGVNQSTVSRIDDDEPDDANASSNGQTLMSGGRAYERTTPTRTPDLEPPPDDPLPSDVAEQIDQRNAERSAPEPEVWTPDETALRDKLESGQTIVVSQRGHHDRLINWAINQQLYLRVDRRTEWGNPFETPADGDRDTVIANYRDHYLPNKPSLHRKRDLLTGKALGCWCAPEPCHGDVLAAWADSRHA